MRYKIALRKTDEGDSVSVPGCRAVGRKVLTDLDGDLPVPPAVRRALSSVPK
jgi:hypothetical protein